VRKIVFLDLRNGSAKSSAEAAAIAQPKPDGFTALATATIYEPLLGSRLSSQVSVPLCVLSRK